MDKREFFLKLLKDHDRETIRSELKSCKLLEEINGLETIARECIAFANRIGGYLIIGVTDDGDFEGKNLFDLDQEKGRINNYLNDKISPKLEYTIDYFEYNNGDLLIITIYPFKDIPHAIIKGLPPNIKWRNYYYRTPHGIKLLSDKQLKYLFLNEKLDFNYKFRIIINYDDEFKVNWGINVPNSILQSYGSLLANLPENIIKKILSDRDKIRIFLMEITPYLVLRNFAWIFQQTWNVTIEDTKQAMSDRIKTLEDYNSKIFTYEDIPPPTSKIFLEDLKFDLIEMLNKITFPKFKIPLDLKISITSENNTSIFLMMMHPDFVIKIRFEATKGGIYLIQYDPQFSYIYDKLGGTQFQEIIGEFKVEFKFPESDFETFDDYIRYVKNLRKLLEEEWSYDYFQKAQPNNTQYTILKKLDEILSKM